MLSRTSLVALAAAMMAALLTPAFAAADPAGSTLLQSRASGLAAWPKGIVNDAASGPAAVSADGCRAVFTSTADGLVSTDDDTRPNVYVRDLCADTIALVSGGGDARDARTATISPNGRYVAFHRGIDQAPWTALFRRDLDTGTTVRVTTADVNWNFPATVADDGTVAFTTLTKLDAANDANSGPDAYTSDGTTTKLVSRRDGADGAALGNVGDTARISGDGTTVAFLTQTAVDAALDTNGQTDAYVRTGTTTKLVSRRDGQAGTAAGPVSEVALDADGDVAAFVTTMQLDVANDTNVDGDVYRRAGDSTVLVSRRDGNGVSAGYWTENPSVSADGSRIAFESKASQLVGATEGGVLDSDVFVRDVPQARTIQISRAGLDGAYADGTTYDPAISADGAFVVATTDAANLMAGDDDDFKRVLRRRIADAATDLVSAPSAAPFTGAGVNEAYAGFGMQDTVSADGRYVLFLSRADALRDDDANRGFGNAYLRDNRTDATLLVRDNVRDAALSDDARHVAFTTDDRLDPKDTNVDTDAYRLDRETGAVQLMSRRNSDGAATGGVTEIALSADGTTVAFVSNAIADSADTTNQNSVYVRRAGADTTVLTSRRDGTGASLTARAEGISLSGTGRYVTFATTEAVEAPDTGTSDDIYRRDLEQGDTLLVSRTSSGAAAGSSRYASISDDGRRVAFDSFASLVPADTTSATSVYVRDIPSETTILASVNGSGQNAAGLSEAPAISGDGKRVAFASFASNLDGTHYGRNVYLRDLDAGTTKLVTRRNGLSGAVADNQFTTALSLNTTGRCVAFLSRGSLTPDVHAPGDFAQVYLRAVDGECPDETAPDTEILTKPAARIAETAVSLTFAEPSDEDVTFECRLDDEPYEECTAPQPYASLGEGEHRFEVRAFDAAGNRDATPAQATFTVDLTAPQTTLDGPSGRTNDTSPAFTFGADEDARFQCQLDGEGWEDCDAPSRELDGLADGPHTFAVKAIDLVGHEDASPAIATFTVDTAAPVAEIGAVTAADDGTAAATFTAETGATFTCAIDGGDFAACTSPARFTGLAVGDHTLKVRATDEAGNPGAVVTRAFTVPAKPVTKPDQKPTGGDKPKQEQPAPAPAPAPQPAPRGTDGGAASTSSATLLTRSAKVAANGRVTVQLRCTAGACRGTVVLKAKAGRRTITLARGSYSVAGGTTAKLTLKLSAAGRKALKRAKRLKATVELGGAAASLTLKR